MWVNETDTFFRKVKPSSPTVHGEILKNPDHFATHHCEYPSETILERARRLSILDEWRAVCIFTCNSRVTVRFEGNRATQMWGKWLAKQKKGIKKECPTT